MQGEVLTVAQAAAYLGLGKSLLNRWRMASRVDEGPNWIRLGKRRVGYRKADLDEWLQRNLKGPAR